MRPIRFNDGLIRFLTAYNLGLDPPRYAQFSNLGLKILVNNFIDHRQVFFVEQCKKTDFF
jgi:hypothetical protein